LAESKIWTEIAMVEINVKIRLKHGVKTKGISLKKGQVVTAVDYPYHQSGYYNPYMTVNVKGYGRVSVHKNVLHKTALDKVLKKIEKKMYPHLTRWRKGRKRTGVESFGTRRIDGEIFHDSGYHGRAARAKQKYYQENGSKTRLIKVGGTTVLFVRSGRKRRS